MPVWFWELRWEKHLWLLTPCAPCHPCLLTAGWVDAVLPTLMAQLRQCSCHYQYPWNCRRVTEDGSSVGVYRATSPRYSFTEGFQPLCPARPPAFFSPWDETSATHVQHLAWGPQTTKAPAFALRLLSHHLLPKNKEKWMWWRYSAGQQYLWREGFSLDINQYIIAYVACLSSLLMI